MIDLTGKFREVGWGQIKFKYLCSDLDCVFLARGPKGH